MDFLKETIVGLKKALLKLYKLTRKDDYTKTLIYHIRCLMIATILNSQSEIQEKTKKTHSNMKTYQVWFCKQFLIGEGDEEDKKQGNHIFIINVN